jgi:leader peptidase (prepilin peptidase)/N-methyltransferase
VELLSSVLWVLAGVMFGVSLQTLWAVFFFYMLLILSCIDLDLRRLPNGLVALLFGVGLVGVLISQFTRFRAIPLLSTGTGFWGQPIVAASIGAVAAAGLTLAIAALYERVRHVRGSGMGDVKLLAAIGLYLGPYALLALFIANIIGAAFGVVTARSRGVSLRAVPLPFGPFLAGAAVLVTAWGPALWGWYLSAHIVYSVIYLTSLTDSCGKNAFRT